MRGILDLALLVPVLCVVSTAALASPNVLLILLDDWGWDSTDLDGELAPGQTTSDIARTPSIAQLAANGVTYRQFYTNSGCSPSRARLWTGRPTTVTGWGGNGIREFLNVRITTLPKVLRDAGYATALFGKWHLNGASPEPWFCHQQIMGFDTFVHTRKGGGTGGVNYFDYEVRENCGAVTTPPAYPISPGNFVAQYQPSYLADRTIDWIDDQEQLGNSWFAVYSPKTPHGGWVYPPHELLSNPNLSIPAGTVSSATATPPVIHFGDTPADNLEHVEYVNAMIEAGDTEIGRMLATVDMSTTTVIVVSDNGPSGAVMDERFYDPSRGKGTSYDLGVRVPLFVAGPLVDSLLTNHYSDALIDMTDLFRTVVEMVGAPPNLVPDTSKSFMHTFTGGALPADARTMVAVSTFNDVSATVQFESATRIYREALVTDGVYTILENEGTGIEMYHRSDPHQLTDLNDGSLTSTEQAAWDELSPHLYVTLTNSAAVDTSDNDGDQFTDLADPGVEGDLDPLETGFMLGCDDGLDNDGDGLKDMLDPGCSNPADSTENVVACNDGLDNDGDGLADYPRDPDCSSPIDEDERDECSNLVDDDGDGLVDLAEPACQACADGLGLCIEAPACSNALDDDGDGLVDYPDDPDCAGVWGNRETETQRSCGLGFEAVLVLVPLSLRLSCRRSRSK